MMCDECEMFKAEVEHIDGSFLCDGCSASKISKEDFEK